MGVAGDFFHGNETEVQKFKPDCVIVSYHHIVDDRPSYIIYIIYIYKLLVLSVC